MTETKKHERMKKIFGMVAIAIVAAVNVVLFLNGTKDSIIDVNLAEVESLAQNNEIALTISCNRCGHSMTRYGSYACCSWCGNVCVNIHPAYTRTGTETLEIGSVSTNQYWEGSTLKCIIRSRVSCPGTNPSNCIPGNKVESR